MAMFSIDGAVGVDAIFVALKNLRDQSADDAEGR
jgi:hypothetical protein